jgi:hypothetical protein
MMGKGKKSKKSVKQATPIRLPHDGPINERYHSFLQKETKLRENDIIEQAAQLLIASEAKASSSLETTLQALSLDPKKQPKDLRLLQFLDSLQIAEKIQQQLQALHTFKSWLLQSTDREEPALGATVYRILLEWMLSAQTPVTLRRALQSVLTAITFVEENSTSQPATAILSPPTSEAVHRDVFQSLLAGDDLACWSDHLHSLQEALQWEPFREILRRDSTLLLQLVQVLRETAARLQLQLESSSETSQETVAVWDGAYLVQIQQCIKVTHLIETVLGLTVDVTLPFTVLQDLREFLWTLLACRAFPADSLTIVSISYGRILMLLNDVDKILLSVLPLADSLLELPRAELLQGLAATLPMDHLLTSWSQDDALRPLQTLLASFEKLALESSDPEVRLTALKGIRTLVSRCHALEHHDNDTTSMLSDVAHRTLELVLRFWENPPTKRLANGISALFQSLIRWMQQLEERTNDVSSRDDKQQEGSSFFSSLVRRLLAQPPHRKGRYVALETLLPVAGAQAMLDGSNRLLEDLLVGIGDHGHNKKAIADLWAKLLQKLAEEMCSQECQAADIKRSQRLPEAWLDVWVPSLANAMVSKKLTRRKQMSDFCLPRIVTVVGEVTSRPMAAQAFAALFRELQRLSEGASAQLFISQERETFEDRILWTQLEIARLAANQGLLQSKHVEGQKLRNLVASSLPRKRLRAALTHASAPVRITALQSMSHIVGSYDEETEHSLDTIKQEMELFKYMLPFAIKTEGKEYVASVLECLLTFLDRLMMTEAKCLPKSAMLTEHLPETFSFIVGFLLGDMINFLGYPGCNVAAKETFLLAMLECITLFSAREFSISLDSKLLPKNSNVWKRNRRAVEEATLSQVRMTLVGPEVFASLFSILHSRWDSTRVTAYKLFTSLLVLAQDASVAIPSDFCSGPARKSLLENATLLASSPRQREADTGSRLLAILCHSLLKDSEKKLHYVTELVDILEDRLDCMKRQLAAIVGDYVQLTAGNSLPLAHGLIQALRLVVENDRLFLGEVDSQMEQFLSRMAKIFNHAIQISLSVVADVRDGEILEGMETNVLFSDADSRVTKPVETKVNPGTIGANGIFSSINRVTEDEHLQRLASQRIVIGSWLLTKETCAAIAAIITVKTYRAPVELVDTTGMLLISTLTSLKHTGAVFAAHRAIQKIATRCLGDDGDSTLQQLPAQWTKRLLDEVSEVDRVRHSTLRRSTGYALGMTSHGLFAIPFDTP